MCLFPRTDSSVPYNKSKIRYKVAVKREDGLFYPIFYRKIEKDIETPYKEINECEHRGISTTDKHDIGFHVFISIEDCLRFIKDFSELKFVSFEHAKIVIIEVAVDDFNTSGIFYWRDVRYKEETWRKMIILKEVKLD